MRKLILIIGVLTISIVALVMVNRPAEPCMQFHPDSQNKDLCLADYAEQHKDPEICELIYREILREGCYHDIAVLTNNIELCKKMISLISEAARGLCFKTIAINLTDETICEYIDDEGQRSGCYWDMAELTKNKTICNKITPEKLREECIKQVEEIK